MKRAQEVAVHQQPENRIFRLNFFTSLLKIRERIEHYLKYERESVQNPVKFDIVN